MSIDNSLDAGQIAEFLNELGSYGWAVVSDGPYLEAKITIRGGRKSSNNSEGLRRLALALTNGVFVISHGPNTLYTYRYDEAISLSDNASRLHLMAVELDRDADSARLGESASPPRAQSPHRTLNADGRATDGKPIMGGEVFQTISGRLTTPYPKQKSTKYASEWLKENAIAEAESRGDQFNARSFRAVTLLKDGSLAQADIDGMMLYLYVSQPEVVPSILKPLVDQASNVIPIIQSGYIRKTQRDGDGNIITAMDTAINENLSLLDNVKSRFTADAGASLEGNQVLMNAARPLVGIKTYEGAFLSGRYYAVLDPLLDSFSQNLQTNLKLDASCVIFATEDEQLLMAINQSKYVAEYLELAAKGSTKEVRHLISDINNKPYEQARAMLAQARAALNNLTLTEYAKQNIQPISKYEISTVDQHDIRFEKLHDRGVADSHLIQAYQELVENNDDTLLRDLARINEVDLSVEPVNSLESMLERANMEMHERIQHMQSATELMHKVEPTLAIGDMESLLTQAEKLTESLFDPLPSVASFAANSTFETDYRHYQTIDHNLVNAYAAEMKKTERARPSKEKDNAIEKLNNRFEQLKHSNFEKLKMLHPLIVEKSGLADFKSDNASYYVQKAYSNLTKELSNWQTFNQLRRDSNRLKQETDMYIRQRIQEQKHADLIASLDSLNTSNIIDYVTDLPTGEMPVYKTYASLEIDKIDFNTVISQGSSKEGFGRNAGVRYGEIFVDGYVEDESGNIKSGVTIKVNSKGDKSVVFGDLSKQHQSHKDLATVLSASDAQKEFLIACVKEWVKVKASLPRLVVMASIANNLNGGIDNRGLYDWSFVIRAVSGDTKTEYVAPGGVAAAFEIFQVNRSVAHNENVDHSQSIPSTKDNIAELNNIIAVAADSLDKLRSQDVYRVLELGLEIKDGANLQALAQYIIENRNDLRDEVSSALSELENNSSQALQSFMKDLKSDFNIRNGSSGVMLYDGVPIDVIDGEAFDIIYGESVDVAQAGEEYTPEGIYRALCAHDCKQYWMATNPEAYLEAVRLFEENMNKFTLPTNNPVDERSAVLIAELNKAITLNNSALNDPDFKMPLIRPTIKLVEVNSSSWKVYEKGKDSSVEIWHDQLAGRYQAYTEQSGHGYGRELVNAVLWAQSFFDDIDRSKAIAEQSKLNSERFDAQIKALGWQQEINRYTRTIGDIEYRLTANDDFIFTLQSHFHGTKDWIGISSFNPHGYLSLDEPGDQRATRLNAAVESFDYYAEPSQDSTQADWDSFWARMDNIPDPVIARPTFKTIAEQRVERQKERATEVYLAERKLPMGVRRALANDAVERIAKELGIYIDGSFTNPLTARDATQLLKYSNKASKKEKDALSLVARHTLSDYIKGLCQVANVDSFPALKLLPEQSIKDHYAAWVKQVSAQNAVAIGATTQAVYKIKDSKYGTITVDVLGEVDDQLIFEANKSENGLGTYRRGTVDDIYDWLHDSWFMGSVIKGVSEPRYKISEKLIWASGPDLLSAKPLGKSIDIYLRGIEVLEGLSKQGKLDTLMAFAGVSNVDAFNELPAQERQTAYERYIDSGEKPVALIGTYDDHVRNAEQDAVKRRLESTDTVYAANDKPFKSQKSAQAFIDANDINLSHEVIPADNGYVVSRMSLAAQAEARRIAEGRESWVEAQSAVLQKLGHSENGNGEYGISEDDWERVDYLTKLRLDGNIEYSDEISNELHRLNRFDNALNTGDEIDPTKVQTDFKVDKGLVVTTQEIVGVRGGDKSALRNYKNSPGNLNFASEAAAYMAIRDRQYYAVVEGNSFGNKIYNVVKTDAIKSVTVFAVPEITIIVAAPNGRITKHLLKSESELLQEKLAKAEKITADLSIRSDGLFTSFFPNTPAGEDVFRTMAQQDSGNSGKVLNIHAADVISQIREAGYTVENAQDFEVSTDELYAALMKPAATNVELKEEVFMTSNEEKVSNVVAMADWRSKAVTQIDASKDKGDERREIVNKTVKYVRQLSFLQFINNNDIGSEFERARYKGEVELEQKSLTLDAQAKGLGIYFEALPVSAEIEKLEAISHFFEENGPIFKSTDAQKSLHDIWIDFSAEYDSYILSGTDRSYEDSLREFIKSGSVENVTLYGLLFMQENFRGAWSLLNENYGFTFVNKVFNRIYEQSPLEMTSMLFNALGAATERVVNELPTTLRCKAAETIKESATNHFTEVRDTVEAGKYFARVNKLISKYKFDLEKMSVTEDDKAAYAEPDYIEYFIEKYKFDYETANQYSGKVRAALDADFEERWNSSTGKKLVDQLRAAVMTEFQHEDIQVDFEGSGRLTIAKIERGDSYVSIALDSSKHGQDWINDSFDLSINSHIESGKIASSHAKYEHIKIPSFLIEDTQEAISCVAALIQSLPDTGIKYAQLEQYCAEVAKIQNESGSRLDKASLVARLKGAVERGILPSSVKYSISEPHHDSFKIKISGLPMGMSLYGDGYEQYIKDKPRYSYWDNDFDSPMRYSPAYQALHYSMERIAKLGLVCTDDGDNGNYPRLYNFHVSIDIAAKLEDEMAEQNFKDTQDGISRNAWKFTPIDYVRREEGLNLKIANVKAGKLGSKAADTILQQVLDQSHKYLQDAPEINTLAACYRDLLIASDYGISGDAFAQKKLDSKIQEVKQLVQTQVEESQSEAFQNYLKAGAQKYQSLIELLDQCDYEIAVQDLNPSTGLPYGVIHKFNWKNTGVCIAAEAVRADQLGNYKLFQMYDADNLKLAIEHIKDTKIFYLPSHFYGRNASIVLDELVGSQRYSQSENIKQAFNSIYDDITEKRIKLLHGCTSLVKLKRLNDAWGQNVVYDRFTNSSEEYITLNDGNKYVCVSEKGSVIDLTADQYSVLIAEGSTDNINSSADYCYEWIEKGCTVYQINTDSMRNFRIIHDDADAYLLNMNTGESSLLNESQRKSVDQLIERAGEVVYRPEASLSLH